MSLAVLSAWAASHQPSWETRLCSAQPGSSRDPPVHRDKGQPSLHSVSPHCSRVFRPSVRPSLSFEASPSASRPVSHFRGKPSSFTDSASVRGGQCADQASATSQPFIQGNLWDSPAPPAALPGFPRETGPVQLPQEAEPGFSPCGLRASSSAVLFSRL